MKKLLLDLFFTFFGTIFVIFGLLVVIELLGGVITGIVALLVWGGWAGLAGLTFVIIYAGLWKDGVFRG